MDDKLYFNSEDLQFIQTELMFRCFAQQKVLIHMKIHPDKIWSEQEVSKLRDKFHNEILREMYENYGHTPMQ